MIDYTSAQYDNYSQIKMNKTSKYEQFIATGQGKQIVDQYGLDCDSQWHAFGESDGMGSHGSPDLGIYEGKLCNVIMHVVNLPQFWAWGYGGRVEKYVAPKIIKIDDDTGAKLAKLMQERKNLEEKLQNLNSEVGKYNL